MADPTPAQIEFWTALDRIYAEHEARVSDADRARALVVRLSVEKHERERRALQAQFYKESP